MGSGQHMAQNYRPSGTNDMTSCSSWFHVGCEHLPKLPRSNFPASLHHSHRSCCFCFNAQALKSQRSTCCPAQCVLHEVACFHPCAQTAMSSSNTLTDVAEVTGSMRFKRVLQPAAEWATKNVTSSCGYFFFQNRKNCVLNIKPINYKTPPMQNQANDMEAYHQCPTRLFPP